MGVKNLDELIAFQLAGEFKRGVYQLIRTHPLANHDFDYRRSLIEAVRSVEKNIAEGWKRYLARDMAQFLRIALGSLEEAKIGLKDGVDCQYFSSAEIRPLLEIGNRCTGAITRFMESMLRSAAERERPGIPDPKRRPRRRRATQPLT